MTATSVASSGDSSIVVAGSEPVIVRLAGVSKIFWSWSKNPIRPTPSMASKALDDISLEVTQGEFVAIVGPSGCGKSTLLSIIAGLDSDFYGEVALNGKSKSEVIPGTVGMVFQDVGLLPWLTAEANIMLGLQGTLAHVWPGKLEAKQRAAELLQLVGLRESANLWPHQLSGGMRQRVAIARALVANPSILLMDEPFGALDAQTRTVLQDELGRIHESIGMTTIFVTHDIDEAIYLADRVVVMGTSPGRVVDVCAISLQRPRSAWDCRATAAFAGYRSRIWSEVRPMLESRSDLV